MGLTQSVEIPEGGTEGYHVHGVQENSPAHRAGLEPYFDFIITIGHTRLNKENDMLKDLLKANAEKPVKLEVFSIKALKVREVEVVPSNMWGGQGLLGASVRFCSFHGANERVWHVLDIEPNSPASLAGLHPYTDYIIGSDQVLQEAEDFFTLIETHEGKPLKLMVYNSDTDICREVVVTPNGAWGGEGSLGCGIGYGYLHRIPSRPVMPEKKVEIKPPSPLPSEDSLSTQSINGYAETQPTNGYTEASLVAPSSQTDFVDGAMNVDPGLANLPIETTPLPPPIHRVMDPGFIDAANASVPELTDLSQILDVSSVSFNMSANSLAGTETLLNHDELSSFFDQAQVLMPEHLSSSSEQLLGASIVQPGLEHFSLPDSTLAFPPLPYDPSCSALSDPEHLVEEMGHLPSKTDNIQSQDTVQLETEETTHKPNDDGLQ
ncbi:Golgi reassembly-stacking protein 1b isoform X1 [Latimeria chalumnae]|uniref:Golgi reassembly-stacking protein 1b isoform X1 n=1 Tax=Latimeria chalumnae TaxID=7897 RepID=UPI00313AAAF6